MAGKRKPLSPAQQVAINTIRETGRKFREGRAETEARIRQQVKEENNALELTHALAIRRAKELDVPISTIGVAGLGTADRNTVHRWLKKTERMVVNLQGGDTPNGVFGWEDKAAGIVRVYYESFPTTISADDYPTILEGTAKIDENSKSGWTVVTDPGTIVTDMGDLRGWFSVEIEDIAPSVSGSLASQLDEWVEENR